MNEIKGIVSGNEVDISKVAMLVNGVDKGWEVRTQNGDILWGADRTLTGTDTIQMKGYGLPLKSVHVEGNGQQTGTPTSDAPIMPDFCGVRTRNLFDMSDFSLTQVTSTAYRYGTSIGVLPQGSYTFSATKLAGAQSIYLTAKLNNTYTQTTISSVPFTFVADGESEYIIRTANNTGTTWEAEKYSDMMLNAGSTLLPYEPYGWAEKITCGGQTTPVYLGETPTVRRIGKYVFTGQENITRTASGANTRMYYVIASAAPSSPLYCTHFLHASDSSVYPPVGKCYINGISNFIMGVDGAQFETADDFKTYLSTQYANGTPVTVWYVLAEPETGIVNEPLAKIGDYADTITVTADDVQITPAVGNDTLTVDTTIPPSAVTVVGHVKSRSVMTLTQEG